MNKILILGCILIAQNTLAQDITGKWTTIDDNTGKKRSLVEIYKQGDKYFGKISDIYLEPHEPKDPICEFCSDDRKDQKTMGMEIIRNMEKDGDEYSGGDILDPENGNVYRCKLWIEEGKLMVRGYVAFFFRTQEWVKTSD
ncbi:MAG: hypothetical protein ACJA2S_003489 [Cyclobacteriaceae bacterium]|jgi:uncharacterized protein (DUF2147 family)